MFIFSLLILCSFSIVYDGHYYWHRTANFGMQRGTFNLTADMHIMLRSEICSPLDLALDIAFMQNKIIVAKSQDPEHDETGLCTDIQAVSVLQSSQIGTHHIKGVVLFLESGSDKRSLQNLEDYDTVEGFPFPIVYVTSRTYIDIATPYRSDGPREITLSMDYDIESHVPSHAPSLHPSASEVNTKTPSNSPSTHPTSLEMEIEAPRKNIWWWLSATTLQDWLFLLFGFLCVILLLLIFLKFYKLCRRRVNNSVVVRNLRVRRIERIATVKYDPNQVMNDSCVVCLDDFESDTPIKVLGCRHGYHPRCIDIWLMQSDKCPLCNTDALKSKKRVYDPCFCFCYRNADNFGFQPQDREDPEARNVELPNIQNTGNRFEDALIQH